MNDGGWNLVDPAGSPSDTMDGASIKSMTASEKRASFAWRGGQERQTTGAILFVYCRAANRTSTTSSMLPLAARH